MKFYLVPTLLLILAIIIYDGPFVAAAEIASREFEYRIVSRNLYAKDEATGKDPSPLSDGDLNKYGREGWQLCGIINGDWNPGLMSYRIPNAQLIFKRPKPMKRTQSG